MPLSRLRRFCEQGQVYRKEHIAESGDRLRGDIPET